ncbi:MAG: transmembrane anchor protein [Pseudomonadales bacterium]
MYQNDSTQLQQLPSAARLLRSTVLALATALALLFTVVLPAEYAIDVTGIGRLLGLTQMGEIKEQLATEAAAEELAVKVSPTQSVPVTVQSAVNSTEVPVAASKVGANTAIPKTVTPIAVQSAEPVLSAPKSQVPLKQARFVLTLKPGQGVEFKLEMREGAKVSYQWRALDGELNYDTHGDPYKKPKGFYHGYGKGRFVPGDSGELVAAFDGYHGWFWRNRMERDVQLVLEAQGEFIKEVR